MSPTSISTGWETRRRMGSSVEGDTIEAGRSNEVSDVLEVLLSRLRAIVTGSLGVT